MRASTKGSRGRGTSPVVTATATATIASSSSYRRQHARTNPTSGKAKLSPGGSFPLLLLCLLVLLGGDFGGCNTIGCDAFVPSGSAVATAATATARGDCDGRSAMGLSEAPNRTPPTTTRLRMNFFSDMFESWQSTVNTGGSYNLGIDYDKLPFPGPEAGAMAIAATAQIRQQQQQQSRTGAGEESVLVVLPARSPSLPHLELATLAGGCFWGLELALRRVPGVEHTLVGYTQGADTEVRPNYEQVVAGNTGHCESVLVYFDPTVVSYGDLLAFGFLRRIDDLTSRNGGMGKDAGDQYRTGIYYHTADQKDTALRLIEEELASNPKYEHAPKRSGSAMEVKPARAFWPAEEYHQRYLEKGGRFGRPQSAEKGSTDEIRCYG